MIWLFGDSIFHGHSLGRELETYTRSMIAAEPLWSLRNPGTTINLLWRERRAMPGLSGRLMIPDRTDQALKEMRSILTSGRIVDGDTVVLLDVGRHHGDPDAAQACWLAFRRALLEHLRLRLVICTAFGAVSPGRSPFSKFEAELYMHDLAFGDRSHNDAVRAAAQAPVEGAGTTELVEIGAAMSAFEDELRREGLTAYLRDGIHPNIWGQTALAILLCRALESSRPIHVDDALGVLDGQPAADRHAVHLRRLAAAA